jgi:hypothetical protein
MYCMAPVSSSLSFLRLYISSPMGMVNEPMSGWLRPMNMLSYTVQTSFGQNSGDVGRGSLKLIRLFIVGFGPVGPG